MDDIKEFRHFEWGKKPIMVVKKEDVLKLINELLEDKMLNPKLEELKQKITG